MWGLLWIGVGATAPASLPDPVEPSTRNEVPVLLIPGWLDTGRDLAAMRIRLLGAGWDQDAVRTLTFDEPTGSNRDHAHEIAAAVSALMAETGAAEVDIVAHSMGGLATRWYLLRQSPEAVRRVVFIGSPHRGPPARDEHVSSTHRPRCPAFPSRARGPRGEPVGVRPQAYTRACPA